MQLYITQPLKNKKRNLAIFDNMDGSRGYYDKWNRSGRERQILYFFTYMWNLKIKTNKQNKKNTDSQIQRTNRWLPEGRGVEEKK